MTNLKGTMEAFIGEAIEGIRREAAGRPVLCALSGGVDSAVCAVLAQRAVGDKLTCAAHHRRGGGRQPRGSRRNAEA